MNPLQIYGRVNGISRIGDLLRLYMLPWLAFYATEGTPADRVLFISISLLFQSVPSLCLSHYTAHVIRRVSPLSASILANSGLGALSFITAVAVLAGFTPQWLVLLVWVLVGVFEVVYYPARDCLYAALASGDTTAREQANRSSVAIFQVGRFALSVIMVGVIWLLGSVGDDMPRGVIATALAIDAATFGIVVAFLTTLKGRVEAIPTPDRESAFPGTSLRETVKVPGAVPLLVCILVMYSFANSRFFFNFGFYKDFVGVGESERQMSFQIVQCACALGGYFGGRLWKLNFHNIVASFLAMSVSEALFAFVPKNPIWGTAWMICNSFTSVMLFTMLFDGIIPQLVQGLERNAEVSSAITLMKEGVSPVLLVGVTGLASYLNAPRHVLFGACVVTLVIVAFILFAYRTSVRKMFTLSA